MKRLDIAFALVVASSLALAGVAGYTAWATSDDPHAETVESLRENVSVTVVEAELTDESLDVSLRVRNPTDHPINLTGAYVRAKNETVVSLAGGAATRESVSGDPIEFRGELTVTYAVRLSNEEVRALRAARSSGGFVLTGRQSFEYRNESFVVEIPGTEVG